jgi:uncharacterized protein (TIGR02117 family)
MKLLRTASIAVYRILEVLLLSIALWLVAAFALSSIRVNADYSEPTSRGIEIFISSNGVHTDFVLPVRNEVYDWNAHLPLSDFNGTDTTWSHIAFGWGNKDFYVSTPTWNDLTFTTAFKAAFGIGPAAMHITRYRQAPAAGGNCRRFILSEEQYKNLVHYLQKHLQHSSGSAALINHPGYGYHDRFYESAGRYSLLTTCNEWTGNGMEAAGLPSGVWTPLEFMIMDPVR